MREAKSIDLFLLGLLGLIWGSSFFNIKIATYSYDPFTLALIRVVFASIPLFLLCKYKNIKIEAFTKNWKPYAIIGLCNIAIPFTLIAIGTAGINSYLAAMLMSTTPMSGSILAHFFTNDEKITLFKSIGIIVGFLGILFLFFESLFCYTKYPGSGRRVSYLYPCDTGCNRFEVRRRGFCPMVAYQERLKGRRRKQKRIQYSRP